MWLSHTPSWSSTNTYCASVLLKHLRYGPPKDPVEVVPDQSEADSLHPDLMNLFAFSRQIPCPKVSFDLVHPANACFTSVAYRCGCY